jgi:TPR repeat protein
MAWWLRWAMAIALGLTVTAGGAPLSAQDDAAPGFSDLPEPPAPLPIPYPYGNDDGPDPAPRDKLPRIIAQQEAAAAAVQQACDGGDQAGCTALARAYLYGEGKPQSRKVAELLLRDGCTAGEAGACHELGKLLVSLRKLEAVYFGVEAFDRACQLGQLDACDEYASLIEQDMWAGTRVDPVAAAALREATCARGGAAACTTLATRQFEAENDPAARQAGKARLDALCSEGAVEACSVLITKRQQAAEWGAPPDPELRELFDRGCRAGLADGCRQLGRAVFAESDGPPEGRSAAMALFRRACDLSDFQCDEEREIGMAPQLAAACTAGDQAQCAVLGQLYADSQGVLHHPLAALPLLGGACDAGIVSACRSAADVLLIDKAEQVPLNADDFAAAMRWRLSACEAEPVDCQILGSDLIEGVRLPADRTQGYALISRACEADHEPACDELRRLAEKDPDAPMPLAASSVRPPMTEEEEKAYYAEVFAERDVEEEAYRAQGCTTTTVTFRGTTYTETICNLQPRALGGFMARVGEAPWQALIWRPEKIDGMTLGPRDRVVCGGTLVATGWVLTAAHCLIDQPRGRGGKRYAIEKNPYRIRLGLMGLGEQEGNSYPILRVIRHWNYDPASLAFDIALIQYDPRKGQRGFGTFGAERIAIDRKSVRDRPVVAGRPVYAYGWGVTSIDTSKAAERLQGVKLLLRSDEECARVSTFTQGLRQNSVVCAAGPQNQQACFGDSGGPLVLYGSRKENPVLFGVVSGGWQCGTTADRKPSQYVRIGHDLVQRWLAENLPGFRSGLPLR